MNANPDRIGKACIVATFGGTQLVRDINSRYELRGGSVADHTDALEWISIFLHEAVVSFPSSCGRLPAGGWAFRRAPRGQILPAFLSGRTYSQLISA
jgi:hypothetical protein